MKLTNEQITERIIAWNEAVEALRMWMSDQTESQKVQAQIVVDQIDKMADTWLSSVRNQRKKKVAASNIITHVVIAEVEKLKK